MSVVWHSTSRPCGCRNKAGKTPPLDRLTPLAVCVVLHVISSSPQLPESSIILPPSGELWHPLVGGPLYLWLWCRNIPCPQKYTHARTLARIWLVWIVHEEEKSNEYMFLKSTLPHFLNLVVHLYMAFFKERHSQCSLEISDSITFSGGHSQVEIVKRSYS